jgi:hypothetical protein
LQDITQLRKMNKATTDWAELRDSLEEQLAMRMVPPNTTLHVNEVHRLANHMLHCIRSGRRYQLDVSQVPVEVYRSWETQLEIESFALGLYYGARAGIAAAHGQ